MTIARNAMLLRKARLLITWQVMAVSLLGCVNTEDVALFYGAAQRKPVNAIRADETETLDCLDTQSALNDAAASLQVLGMTVGEKTPAAGLVTGAKSLDPRKAGQIALSFLAEVLVRGGSSVVRFDLLETIRASVLVTPEADLRCQVRIAFERIITDSRLSTHTDSIANPVAYKSFFDAMRRVGR